MNNKIKNQKKDKEFILLNLEHIQKVIVINLFETLGHKIALEGIYLNLDKKDYEHIQKNKIKI